MYCQSCGAPMTLFRERDYFVCEYCGSYHFPKPSLQGIRLLGEVPEGLKCPVCRTSLQVTSLDDLVRGYHCLKCRGLLLDRFAFRDTVYVRRTWATQPPTPSYPLDRTELERRVHCPRCGRPMGTHPYLGPGNIVIDTCDICNLIWLDGTELGRVVSASGPDRGTALHQQQTSRDKEPTDNHRERKRGILIDLTDLMDSLL